MTTTIAVLAQEQSIGFEVMIPGQVFGMANATAEISGQQPPPYDIRVCADGRMIDTVAEWGTTRLVTPFDLDGVLGADIVVVPGTTNFLDGVDPRVVKTLRLAADAGSRIAGMCVGAFTLAAAGLLDGRRATTHWQWAADFAQRYPRVDLDPAVLFVDSGQMLTSAGIAAGLDLCLHLIRNDAGAELAAMTARRLVVPAWRDGGQAQYIEHPPVTPTGDAIQELIDWMEGNLATPITLSDIADRAHTSVRSLNRHFKARVGTTPMQLLSRMRIDRARRLLESSDLPIPLVADQCGFGSLESMRFHFSRAVGVPPQQYRSTYRVDPASKVHGSVSSIVSTNRVPSLL